MLTWLKQPGKPRAGQDRKPLHSSTPWPWLTGTGYMLQPQPFSPSPGVLGAEHAEGYGKGMLATGALSSSTGCSPAPRAMAFWLLLVSLHITAEQTGSRRETGKNSMYVCLNTVLYCGEQGCASHPGISLQSCIAQPGQRETSSPASYLMPNGICSFPTFLSFLSLPPWLQDPLPAGH